MLRDIHNSIGDRRAFSPQTLATGSGITGQVIDRQGFDAVEFVISYGPITATGATFTPTVLSGDATGSLASVADADLLGTEAGAAIAAGARTDDDTENVTKKVGYRGNDRYVRIDMAGTGTSGVEISAVALLGMPHRSPAASG